LGGDNRKVFASTRQHAHGGVMGQGLKVLTRERFEDLARAAVAKLVDLARRRRGLPG
jgi:hypothetical protein